MRDKLTLRELEAFIVSLPLRRPHRWVGLQSAATRKYVVVRIRLSNSVIGWGETQPLPTWGGDDSSRYGETPELTVSVIRDYLVPALRGLDIREIETVHASMNKGIRGFPYAKAAVDVALLDALGRTFSLPVYQLLGGKARERVEVAHSIGLMEIAQATEEAVQVVDEGIKTLKIKIGEDLKRDVQTVMQIRRAVGDGPVIRVDANQGYKTWREAVTAVEMMREAGVAYAEQLVDGIDELAKVSARTSIPIMADESVWTERDVVKIARLDAAQYISTYYTKPGGISRAKRLLTVAGAHGIRSDINGSGEMGIGNAANVHLAAACPEVTLAGTIPVTSTSDIERTKIAGRKYVDDIIDDPFDYDDGFILVPDNPGLGITVNEDKVRKYSTGSTKMELSND